MRTELHEFISKSAIVIQAGFEYAIKWEHVRADYFRSHGYRSRADDCVKAAKELEWRLAMASTTGDNDVITGDALVDAGWVPEQEAVKGS